MSEEARAEWVTVATYSTGLEADIARDALESADIPVMVLSGSAGIFGLSFQGSVPGGVALQVPSPELERAMEVLEGDAEPGDRVLEDDHDSLIDEE
jgi:hypothetical protein